MKSVVYLTASALALASMPAPLAAQMSMPGMSMPGMVHVHKSPPAKAKKSGTPSKKKKQKKFETPGKASSPAPAAMPEEKAAADSRPAHDHSAMPESAATGATSQSNDMSSMPGMDHAGGSARPAAEMTHGDHAMPAALGPYPMQRESSGTAWQPDASEHMGAMSMKGGWSFMAHGVVNLVADHQSGPRGDDKLFAGGMLMAMAKRPLGNGTVQFRAGLSPDPLMGPRGYPLLLASGETANGIDRLTDRQHPHDFFMELSASVSQNIGGNGSLFLYGGLPGEPAFGPPAFMHREAILDSPEAPISHHWLDSTHISFGVVTAGVVAGPVKMEVSRFNGREPDQHRWNIETGPLDSTAVRVSWNPTGNLALQGSWGHFVDPEQLEPGVNQERLSASALYAREISPGWKLATTLAWGRKTAHGRSDDAFAAEASLKHKEWTFFGRGEITENSELIDVDDGPAFRVGKVSIGAVRDFRISDHFSLGAGGLIALNFVPGALQPLYGGANPVGSMAFVRLKLH